MEFTFPEGCKLVKVENGAIAEERDLAGQVVVLREVNARDRVKAQQRAKQYDTDADDELVRLSVVSFCGEAIPTGTPWAGFGDLNMPAFLFLGVSWAETQGLMRKREDPFTKATEVTTPAK